MAVSRILKPGDRGETVKRLQRILNRSLKRPLAIDGHYGRRTVKVVKRRQTRANLPVDGIVGPQTWRALGVTYKTPSLRMDKPGMRVLRAGCSGHDVKVLQKKLGLTRDGVFGPKTAVAVTKRWPHTHGQVKPRQWRQLGVTRPYWPLSKVDGTPKQLVDRWLLEAQGRGFSHESPQETARANAARKGRPTAGGNISDHSGDGWDTWAADISNGSQPTKEMGSLMRLMNRKLRCPQPDFRNAPSWVVNGLRIQGIYESMIGGNHFNHIHLGVKQL